MEGSARTAEAIDLLERATEAALRKHADMCRGKSPNVRARYVPERWRVDEDGERVLDEDGEPIRDRAFFNVVIYFNDWWDGPRPHVLTAWSESPQEIETMLRDEAFGSWVELKTVQAMEDLHRLQPPEGE